MRFADIPLYPRAHYEIDVDLGDLLEHHKRWTTKYGLTMDQDYQRGHVWTEAQQIAFVEHVLRGGEVGRNIVINSPGFRDGTSTFAEMVDGKQRYTAMLKFANDELRVFGHLRSEFTDRPRCFITLKWRVVELDRLGILDLYLSLNGGGTPHTEEELKRVRALRDLEAKATPAKKRSKGAA